MRIRLRGYLLHSLLALSSLVASSTECRAVSLSLSPISQNVTLGSQAAVAIDISGLGGGTALGAYDVTLGYNAALLSFNALTFGNQLDLFGLGDIQTVTFGAGSVGIFELSLESPSDLNNFQASAFTLATLVFDTLAPGSSLFTLSINSLGDALGNDIAATVQNASVSIAAPGAQVPEPGSFVLLGLGLMGLVGALRHRPIH